MIICHHFSGLVYYFGGEQGMNWLLEYLELKKKTSDKINGNSKHKNILQTAI